MFKVLIIEDSRMYRQILKSTLQYRFPSLDISEAVDGEEALKKITAFSPDLIFMDIRLPGESGLELTRRIKTQSPATTVVILTSYDLPEYREAAPQYKADHFLTKGSTSKDQILKLVESILGDRGIESDPYPMRGS
jgi:YesN/AraC family two-component response regulator